MAKDRFRTGNAKDRLRNSVETPPFKPELHRDNFKERQDSRFKTVSAGITSITTRGCLRNCPSLAPSFEVISQALESLHKSGVEINRTMGGTYSFNAEEARTKAGDDKLAQVIIDEMLRVTHIRNECQEGDGPVTIRYGNDTPMRECGVPQPDGQEPILYDPETTFTLLPDISDDSRLAPTLDELG